MNKYSGLTALAQKYLKYRRDLGFQLKTEGKQVLAFAEYADRSGHKGAISTDLALKWARLPQGASTLYHARRLEVVRCFARYAAIFDERTEIPAKGLLGKAHRRVQPHIYSEEELRKLMGAAFGLSPAGGLRPRTYEALFGVLSSTGLRISEALRLNRNDVDLDQGVLTIAETKFHKSRLVPLHPSSVRYLQEYAQFRDGYCCTPLSERFFLSEGGGELKYSTVRTTFRTICHDLGWEGASGVRRPRLYDFRHTFACRRLLAWCRDGTDLNHAVLALSTYMGHERVTDTYWYLTGTPELMQVAGERFRLFDHHSTLEILQ